MGRNLRNQLSNQFHNDVEIFEYEPNQFNCCTRPESRDLNSTFKNPETVKIFKESIDLTQNRSHDSLPLTFALISPFANFFVYWANWRGKRGFFLQNRTELNGIVEDWYCTNRRETIPPLTGQLTRFVPGKWRHTLKIDCFHCFQMHWWVWSEDERGCLFLLDNTFWENVFLFWKPLADCGFKSFFFISTSQSFAQMRIISFFYNLEHAILISNEAIKLY